MHKRRWFIKPKKGKRGVFYKIVMKNIFRTFFITVLVLMSLSYLLSEIYLNSVVKNKFISDFNKDNFDKYILVVGELETELLKGNILVNDVYIYTRNTPDNSDSLLAYFKHIELLKINISDLINRKNVKIQKVNVTGASLSLRFFPSLIELKYSETENYKKDEPVRKKYINRIVIDEFNVDNARLRFDNAADSLNFNIDGFSLSTKNVHVDTQIREFWLKLSTAQNMNFVIDRFEYNLSDDMTKLAIDTFVISKEDSAFYISELKLKPRFNKEVFLKKNTLNSFHTYMVAKNIKLGGLSFPDFFRKNILKADFLNVEDLVLKTFQKDTNIIHGKEESILPHLFLEGLKYGIDIKKISANSLLIEYQRQLVMNKMSDPLIFLHTHFNFQNISNMEERKKTYELIKVNVESEMLGDAKIDVNMEIPYNNQNGYHKMKGSVSQPDSGYMKTILNNYALKTTHDKKIKAIQFIIEANNDSAVSVVEVIYENQNITKQGKTVVERNRKRSVLNYWTEALIKAFYESTKN